MALELLTNPSLLFLDDPTSGLDPGFEKQVPDDRIGEVPTCDWRWQHELGIWAMGIAVMAGQVLVTMLLAGRALARKEPRPASRRRRHHPSFAAAGAGR